MKIYNLTLDLYISDSVPSPETWNWEDNLKKLNIPIIASELTSCERRFDIESTIPSQEEPSNIFNLKDSDIPSE